MAEDEKARREDNGKEGNHPCTQNRYAISGREEGGYTIETGGGEGGQGRTRESRKRRLNAMGRSIEIERWKERTELM
jgi:hypothetical protein